MSIKDMLFFRYFKAGLLSVQWLQDNRHASYEAEDARSRTRGGVYYSPPGTSYTIVERPASSHGHHTSYSQHYSGKLSRQPYLGSSTIANSTGKFLNTQFRSIYTLGFTCFPCVQGVASTRIRNHNFLLIMQTFVLLRKLYPCTIRLATRCSTDRGRKRIYLVS